MFFEFWQQKIFQVEKFPKTLSERKTFIGNINLGQVSCLNLDKFDIGNDYSDSDWHHLCEL